jgi:uncharacterized membrane protein YjfL (UPF0719 family)
MWSPILADGAEEWDGDEAVLLITCSFAAVFGVVLWWRWLIAVPKLGRGPLVILPLIGTLVLSVGLVMPVAWYWSAKEIRHGQPYMWLVMVMGGACLIVCSGLCGWFGISVREDACERRNAAATVALCGALLGGAFIYCGSITGEGPSFWNNAFSVALGSAVWFALWFGADAVSGVTRAVTEDRDTASGVRFGAYLLAQGLVLGRALAGDWHSAAATTRDLMRDGWPALVLLVLATIVDRTLKPTPSNPFPSWGTRGLPLAAIYFGIAAAWLARLGWWEGAPR